MEKQYWTIEEVKAWSGFAVGTLYNWINAHKIPYVKINGSVSFHIDNTKRFFESKNHKPS